MTKIKDAEHWEREWGRMRALLKSIELRSFDQECGGDEIVANNAWVHLEQMDETNYYLGIRTETEFIQVSIGSDSGRAKVKAIVYGGGKNPT